MRTHRSIVSAAALALALGLGLAYAAEDTSADIKNDKPDATLSITGASAAAGVGATWGSGTLTFQGKTYPFRVRGLEAGDAGVASIDATGEVYHLTKVADFDGTYASAGAAAAAGPGAGRAIMRNANGVVIQLASRREGAQLKAGVDGLRIELSQGAAMPRTEPGVVPGMGHETPRSQPGAMPDTE